MKQGIAYLATPYSKYDEGIEAAYREASRIAGLLLQTGCYVYSPIAHSHSLAMCAGNDPHDHSIWLPFDEVMMEVSATLIVAHMQGWDKSYGVAHETAYFVKAGKPIFDLDVVTMIMRRR